MRQLLVQVPRGHGKEVLEIAGAYDSASLARFEAEAARGPIDVIVIHVSNTHLEGLLGDLEALPQLHVVLIPQGVMPLQPPASEAPRQVRDVTERSPIEVFLGGLQSIGSWKGFLGYATAAGIVVWIGLFTNTVYLLVAAMLIAPFAGPAMNAAIATARGDKSLLGSSLVRYFAAIVVSIIVAGVLSLILGQEIATAQMVAVSQVSAVTVMLPLAAGAAGALNLVQSERNSLVSGAAVGMLVAASLAPPAGLIGMAGAIGRWDMVVSGLFLILLQLVGINLSGAVVFRLFGLTSKGVRYTRGTSWMFPASAAVTILLLAGLLTWQYSDTPNLQRTTVSQRAESEIRKVVDDSGLARLVEANVRFTSPSMQRRNVLLAVLYVQRQSGNELPAEQIRSKLSRAIQDHLTEQGFDLTPLIDITVLDDAAG